MWKYIFLSSWFVAAWSHKGILDGDAAVFLNFSNNSNQSGQSSSLKASTTKSIDPALKNTSRRVTLHREADRLTEYANDIFVSMLLCMNIKLP